MTFLELTRLSRLRQGFTELSRGGRVIDAQVEAGFESASAFRAYFTHVTGLRPSDVNGQGGIALHCCDTPVGPMIIAADQTHLHLLEFVDRRALPREMQKLHRACRGNMGFGETLITAKTEQQVTEFFAGKRSKFDLPLALHGTDFTKRVWRALCDIPAGQTRSYAQLAQMIDNPTAFRGVARANASNQIAIVIPCHRVIGADGALTGYGGGLWRKQKLLEVERAYREDP
jgi:AraC family transcriptional regulator of adaptative response/methylated-DNA-[protein]-cysteine methyltransferase